MNDRKELRIPPQSTEAEQALLGSIMLRESSLHDVIEKVRPEMFYAPKHAKIYEGMLALFSNGTAIDLLSLSDKLEETGSLSNIGDSEYLTEIVNSVPSASNIEHYANIVYKKFMLRQLISAGTDISSLGYDESGDIEDILDEAEKRLYDTTDDGADKGFVAISAELEGAFERLEKLSENSEELRGVPTGFPKLDNKLSGLQPADLVILAARPSMGKTSLALDIARQAAVKHNRSVCIFSLEMSSQQLVDRMLSAQSRVDAWKLRTGKVRADAEFQKLRDALGELSKAPIFIDDKPGNNIIRMRSVARRLKREENLDLIVVDYLQLMLPTGRAKNSDSMVFQITEISRALKMLAKEINVPVVALSQLSRAVEQRRDRPRLSDLRDSGSIEQDADVVMFIHNDDKYKDDPADHNNITEILIEKHRNGPTGKVDLYFDADKTSFLSIETDDFDDIAASSDEIDSLESAF
ncbi:MAG: replicative DNA helicase [Candidatus Paceibacterota bacterium]